MCFLYNFSKYSFVSNVSYLTFKWLLYAPPGLTFTNSTFVNVKPAPVVSDLFYLSLVMVYEDRNMYNFFHNTRIIVLTTFC
jgi:hypothetical protein